MINYLTCSHWNHLSWKCEMKGWLGKGKKSMKRKQEGDCICYESWCFCIPPTNFPTYLINVNCQYMTIHRQGAFPSMGEMSWPSKAYASKTSFLRCLLTTLVVSYLYKRQYSLQLKANFWNRSSHKKWTAKGVLMAGVPYQLSPIPLSFSLPLHLPPCWMHAKDAHVANYAISTKYYFVQN